jgi:membrane protease YdiL (CAAX protease family)
MAVYIAVALELLSVLLLRAFAVLALRKFLHVVGLKGMAFEIIWLIPAVLITFAVPWVFRSRAGWGWSEFGLDLQNWPRLVLIGLVGFSLVFPIQLVVEWLNFERYMEISKAQGSDLAAFAKFPWWQLLLLVLIGQPILTFWGSALPEEFFYRGYLQGVLATAVGPASAFFAVAVYFSFGHYFAVPGGWFFALQTIPGSLLFGFLYLTTGSIIPGIVAHLLSNLVMGYLQFAHFALGTGAFLGLAGAILAVSAVGWFLTRHEIARYFMQGVETIARIPQESWLVTVGFLALLILFVLFRHAFRERLEILVGAAVIVLVLFLLWEWQRLRA